MTKDELKADVLWQLSLDPYTYLLDYLSEKYGEESEMLQLFNVAILELKTESLIDSHPNNQYTFHLTDTGNYIQSIGGYILYKQALKETETKKLEKEQTEYSKLLHEEKLVRWQSKTFWWLFAIALFGGLSGIISLILQII